MLASATSLVIVAFAYVAPAIAEDTDPPGPNPDVWLSNKACHDTQAPCGPGPYDESVCPEGSHGSQCTYCSHYYRFHKDCVHKSTQKCRKTAPQVGDDLGCGHYVHGTCYEEAETIYCVYSWQSPGSPCSYRKFCETQ